MLDKRYGRLTVIKELKERKDQRIVYKCKCDCGNTINVKKIYLTNEDTRSCGCLKSEIEEKNLRSEYDNKRVDGVVKPLFKGKTPRKDSSSGYRGVQRYYTRVSRQERYRAWITVKGKKYYKSGFLTPHDAYYDGRLMLERKHLPNWKDESNGNK